MPGRCVFSFLLIRIMVPTCGSVKTLVLWVRGPKGCLAAAVCSVVTMVSGLQLQLHGVGMQDISGSHLFASWLEPIMTVDVIHNTIAMPLKHMETGFCPLSVWVLLDFDMATAQAMQQEHRVRDKIGIANS